MEISNVIEAMLFATGRDITKEEMIEVLEVSKEQIEKACIDLKQKYSDKEAGIVLIEVGDGLQLVSNNKYYDSVVKLYETNKKLNISNACMEVLSIVAYNPKATKSQIEHIRGVNSDGAVNRLIEYGFVEEVGRLNMPGRPAIYSVTKEFYRNFGIAKAEELPNYEKLKISDEQIMMNEIIEDNVEKLDTINQKEEEIVKEEVSYNEEV